MKFKGAASLEDAKKAVAELGEYPPYFYLLSFGSALLGLSDLHGWLCYIAGRAAGCASLFAASYVA